MQAFILGIVSTHIHSNYEEPEIIGSVTSQSITVFPGASPERAVELAQAVGCVFKPSVFGDFRRYIQ
jgi:hypothetical protein